MIVSEQRVERVEAFRHLIGSLREADVRDDGRFFEVLVECQRLLEMTDLQIADALSVSRPTVSRWMHGKNLPHIGLRKPIFNWFERELGKRVKRLSVSVTPVEGKYATAARAATPLTLKQRG